VELASSYCSSSATTRCCSSSLVLLSSLAPTPATTPATTPARLHFAAISMASLASLLPQPRNVFPALATQALVDEPADDVPSPAAARGSLRAPPSSSLPVLTRSLLWLRAPCSAVKQPPPYGQRQGFVPRAPEDFGDGGAFPEIHVAQYPLDMGRKKKVRWCADNTNSSSSNNSTHSCCSHSGGLYLQDCGAQDG